MAIQGNYESRDFNYVLEKAVTEGAKRGQTKLTVYKNLLPTCQSKAEEAILCNLIRDEEQNVAVAIKQAEDLFNHYTRIPSVFEFGQDRTQK